MAVATLGGLRPRAFPLCLMQALSYVHWACMGRLPEAAAQPGKFALRVCEKCVAASVESAFEVETGRHHRHMHTRTLPSRSAERQAAATIQSSS